MPEEAPTKRERTRQAILDAAYNLIVRQGYAATSMRQVAEGAGLALGGIYNHFASKEEVFRAIIEDRHPFYQIVPILNSVEGETVEEFVRNAAHTMVAELGHHPDFLNLMLTEIVEFKGEHVPLLFERMFPMIMPLAQRITSLDGDMRQIPPPVLMRAFLGMFFSFYITEILIGRAMPKDMQFNALDYFVDIFLHGILVGRN
ncbi:MAG: TetR/AcrR family transcriptional regulator [Chloroflexi bacterium]|nr:TetR/AcrR family transcriptional regulator [Chloroflexota bacterium]